MQALAFLVDLDAVYLPRKLGAHVLQDASGKLDDPAHVEFHSAKFLQAAGQSGQVIARANNIGGKPGLAQGGIVIRRKVDQAGFGLCWPRHDAARLRCLNQLVFGAFGPG